MKCPVSPIDSSITHCLETTRHPPIIIHCLETTRHSPIIIHCLETTRHLPIIIHCLEIIRGRRKRGFIDDEIFRKVQYHYVIIDTKLIQLHLVTIEIHRNSFMPYDVELNQTREATSSPSITRNPSRSIGNPASTDNVENRSADDSNDDDLNSTRRRDRESSAINDSHPRDELYERLNNVWVGVDERLRGSNSQDPERRINLCYRDLVDQYVTLVRRYFDVSRNRDTVSYILFATSPEFFSFMTSMCKEYINFL